MTLTEFLLARIAEDEAAASNWSRFEIRDGIPGSYGIRERVLAECEAKRRIMNEHQDANADTHYEGEDEELALPGLCTTCHDYARHDGQRWPCGTVLAMASIFVGHPDFQTEWLHPDLESQWTA